MVSFLLFEAQTSRRSNQCLESDVVPALLVPAIVALDNATLHRRLSKAPVASQYPRGSVRRTSFAGIPPSAGRSRVLHRGSSRS